MPGLVPGIHILRALWQGVDGRDKPGHDVAASLRRPYFFTIAHAGSGGPKALSPEIVVRIL